VALKSVNGKMDDAQGANVQDSGGLFGGKNVVDQDKYIESLRDQIVSPVVSVDVGGGKIVEVPVDKIDSVEKLRAVLFAQEMGDSG